MTESQPELCGILRRFAAVAYDSILLFAVVMMATVTLDVFVNPQAVQNSNILFQGYLLLVIYLYFVWQWVKGRQTLGMKAWRILLVRPGAERLTWPAASLRFLLALISLSFFGFGLIWILFDADNVTFYDRFSNTRLITED